MLVNHENSGLTSMDASKLMHPTANLFFSVPTPHEESACSSQYQLRERRRCPEAKTFCSITESKICECEEETSTISGKDLTLRLSGLKITARNKFDIAGNSKLKINGTFEYLPTV